MAKLNCAKVESASSVIDSTIESYVKAFPSFGSLSPFYIALIDLMLPLDEVRRCLGRIDGVRREVRRIAQKTNRQINRTTKTDYMDSKRLEAYGRISSLVNGIHEDLLFLAKVREGLKRLPSIPTKHPTIVVAGYPSVGKSLLVRRVSTADPKVAPYPFTTHELTVGVFEMGRARYQIVDTPGLLDRSFEDRNEIEKKAIIALSLLTRTCVYLIDPTGDCGYPLEPQLALLEALMDALPDMSFIVCLNKTDLDLPEGIDLVRIDEVVSRNEERVLEYITLSASTGEGTGELMETIRAHAALVEEGPWGDEHTETPS